MKTLFIFFLICLFSVSSFSADLKLKNKLNGLKRQTVNIHNEFLINNKELKKIKIDIDRNSQKKINIKKKHKK